MTITTDGVWGQCPVQADGFIDGHPWYFRARGEAWSLRVGELGGTTHDAVSVGFSAEYGGTTGWAIARPWMAGDEYAAGWMPHRHAKRLIEIALRWFQEGRLERVEVKHMQAVIE